MTLSISPAAIAEDQAIEEKLLEQPTRTLRVRHLTRCTYENPVTSALHLLRLRPIQDRIQTLLAHTLTVTPDASRRHFEEAFGNIACRCQISNPHQDLTIEADSLVEIRSTDPFEAFTPDYRMQFPIKWMPWERRMLEPYLEPLELPEAQLSQLYHFAHDLAQKNSWDVAETLFALNLMIFREFEYKPGSTTLDTTPFDVYTNRQGVCQDFANFFICLTRLLELPSRYVCGYVLPRSDKEVDPVSQATHAWIEVYLPQVGWKGFDPTNGCLPTVDHVRVAHGRHFRDATPITGWLEPAVKQEMHVEVLVEVVGENQSLKGSDERPASTTSEAPNPSSDNKGVPQSVAVSS
jgi:transglutaminase-like putative cysteine protease